MWDKKAFNSIAERDVHLEYLREVIKPSIAFMLKSYFYFAVAGIVASVCPVLGERASNNYSLIPVTVSGILTFLSIWFVINLRKQMVRVINTPIINNATNQNKE